jgi:hypothetical protein
MKFDDPHQEGLMRYTRAISFLAAIVSLGCADSAVGPRTLQDHGSGAAASKGDALQTTGGAQAKVYCAGTSCYAATFEFKDYPADNVGPYTIFSAYFQNLQGSYPQGSSTPVALNWLHFRFFDLNEGDDWVDADPGYRSFATLGNVVAGIDNTWSNDSPAQGVNYDSFYVTGYGIVGCDGPLSEYPLAFFAFQTCPANGLDGWVRVDFLLRHLGNSPSTAPVRFHDFLFSFGDLSAGTCRIGGNQPGTCAEFPYSKVMKR